MDAKEAIYHARIAIKAAKKATATTQVEFYKVVIENLEKVETLEAENARLGHLLALANQELEKRM